MYGHRWSAVITVVLWLVMGLNSKAVGQSFMERLPADWQSQPISDFLVSIQTPINGQLGRQVLLDEVAQRASATALWMERNDWQSGTVQERLLLVGLLRSDHLDELKFSARWTGYLVPSGTGTFRLSLWDYYKETALDTKVWLDGQLVLDCSGPEADRVFQTGDLALTAGQRLPIQVELRFNRTTEHKIAKPNVILSWESDTQGRQIIPAGNYEPPDDYREQGVNGLKGEYFATHNFENVVQIRLDPELSYVWYSFAVAPRYRSQQREIATQLMSEVMTQLEGAQAPEGQMHPAWLSVYALDGVLTTRESIQVLEKLKQYPDLNTARSPRDLFLFYWRFRYLPDHLSADLVAQWCKAHPLRQSQFGVSGNYDLDEYYGNYNYYWRLGNHLVYTRDGEYLQNSLALDSGGCNLSLMRVLAFYHKRSQTLDDWAAFLDAFIDDPDMSGDTKATWLLARAFAEEVRPSGEPYPLAGRRWLEQAMAAAESESMSLYVIQELVCRLLALNHIDEANSLMASLEPQFTSESAKQLFSQWRQTAIEVSDQFVQMDAAHAAAVDQLYIKRLELRLDRATTRGDQDAVTRYQAKLQEARGEQ